MKAGDAIFVYGTLRPGERMSLKESLMALYLGEDKINGEMYNLGSFPGVVFEPGIYNPDQPTVIGDVFMIKDVRLVAHLDAYEGYPSLYGRTQTATKKGRKVWAYFYKGDVSKKEAAKIGDWKIVKENRLIVGED